MIHPAASLVHFRTQQNFQPFIHRIQKLPQLRGRHRVDASFEFRFLPGELLGSVSRLNGHPLLEFFAGFFPVLTVENFPPCRLLLGGKRIFASGRLRGRQAGSSGRPQAKCQTEPKDG